MKRVKSVRYLCMPLKKNIPVPAVDDWELTTCPECGEECWKKPLHEGFTGVGYTERLCTLCALKKVLKS